MLIADFILQRREATQMFDWEGYIAPGFHPHLIMNAIANGYEITEPRYRVTIHSTIIPGKFEFNVRKTDKERLNDDEIGRP